MSFTYQSYANMPFWNCLPCGMTNYGGDIQVFTIPEYAGSQIGMQLNPWAMSGFYNQNNIADNWMFGSMYGPSNFGCSGYYLA